MGEVWRALDERLRRPVAIKVLRSDVTHDPTCADRFRREALATARVTHPNLVAVFDMDLDHDPPFIAMEFLDGPTVARELKKGPFTEARALAVAEQALRALAALHAVGIVHRDIKPGNIMLVSAGGVETTKVVDLGIAQLKTGTVYQRLTSTGAIVGTPAYMAPEMLEGASAVPASDVWAVGLVLFALLTGRKPFADADLAELVQSVLVPAPAPDVRVFAPAISSQTAVFVGALLEKSPLRRPASAAEALQLMAHLHMPPQRLSLEPQLSFTPRLSLEPRHSFTPPIALAPQAFAPPQSPAPAPLKRTLPWVLALLAGSALTLLFATLIGFGFVTYARRSVAETTVAAPSAPPAPLPVLPVVTAPPAPPTTAPVQVALNEPEVAHVPLNGAPRASASEPSRARGRVAERHGGPVTNGFTSAPSTDLAAPSAGFAQPRSMPSSAAEGYGSQAVPMRTTTARLHVNFLEPTLRIRSSFESRTRDMSARCSVSPRSPGVEFARFVVASGRVSRAGVSGQASPREISCVLNTLSQVAWDGGIYHLTLDYSTSSSP